MMKAITDPVATTTKTWAMMAKQVTNTTIQDRQPRSTLLRFIQLSDVLHWRFELGHILTVHVAAGMFDRLSLRLFSRSPCLHSSVTFTLRWMQTEK